MEDESKLETGTSKAREAFKKYYNTTLLSLALGTSSPQDWKDVQNSVFDKARDYPT
jgi:hypothetical protein